VNKYSFISFALLILYACNETSSYKKTQEKNKVLQHQKKPLIELLEDTLLTLHDSLNMKRDSKNSNYSYSIQSVNNLKFGIITFTDSLAFLYRINKNGRTLYKVDSLIFKDYFELTEKVDLNFDGLEDLLLYGFGNMHGQRAPYVFITSKDSNLYYKPEIRLYNVSVDYKTKQVRSFYVGGIFTTTFKETYVWRNNSLALQEGVKREYTGDTSFITSFYVHEGNREKVNKIVRDYEGTVFENALWKFK
jgi:hypothetical protein